MIIIRHFFFPFVISLISLALVSCALVEERPVEEPAKPMPIVKPKPIDKWAEEQKKRQAIKIWEIRGRLGVQTETNGGSSDIIWQQSERDYSIRLIAPLGAGSYLIQGNDEYAEIRYPDGRKEVIDNVDDVFLSTLEVDLPITAIRDWLRGLPARSLSVKHISWNAKGLLHKVEQAGWKVELKKYTGTKILFPHAIYLSRDDKPELDIRLLLRQWLIDVE